MLNSGLFATFREPGLRRRLTLAFFAVIFVVAQTVPVSFYSFAQIASASNQAKDSAVTLESVTAFQRSLGDVRAAARDFADLPSTSASNRMTTTLRQSLDAARCISNVHACEAPLAPGERLPTAETLQWERLITTAAAAREHFQRTVGADPNQAVATFDRSLADQVDSPAQKLATAIADRSLDAQSRIHAAIYRSMTLLLAVLGVALVLAIILGTVIPRRLTHRLDHLRVVAHRLAHGDLTARADERFANRSDELADLIADFNLMAMALQSQNRDLHTVQEQLHITLQHEQERSTRDPLTGLRNHRYFQDCLRGEIDRSRRTGGVVTIAVLDLDNFKTVNDRFGHSEGDAVLRRAATGISDNLRPYDLACRLGGEEFGIIFPETTAEDAKRVLDRIAAHINPFGPSGERLTFSGGITTWPVHANTQSDLFQRADEASYTAKMEGKAASVVYDPAKVTSMNSEERSRQRSRDAMLTTATTLVSAVDQKDPYTRHHSELVAVYAATVARALRLDEQTVKLVYRAGLLHDVGKIGITDDILLKGTELTHDEWVQLRLHPEFSYRILQAAEMEPVATWTRHHHEHFDGTGYPHGLHGDQIPIGSRIILVCDAFEAMTSDRVYRAAIGVDRAVEELRTCAGLQFDPNIVDVMVPLIEAGVFSQLMQQYGRVIVPHAPAPAQIADAAAALAPAVEIANTRPLIQPAARDEATAWAQQQIAAAEAEARAQSLEPLPQPRDDAWAA
ncbi:MAG: diguanylate cyclase protein/HDIG protein [Thermoleophilia bacterium]|nr:diguanylate cyclase protein/HDIG protein [Thermoleophilia bacterium]